MNWLAYLTAVVYAHQGGWDEVILVAVPVTIFAGLLLVARRRAQSLNDES